MVAKSISWNVSIGCDQRAHLWQQNIKYTKHQIYHPNCILFTHKFQTPVIILIRILTITITFNLFSLVVGACCLMQNDCWRHISTISVNYIQGKPYYAYLSGLDAHSSSYIVGGYFSHNLDMVEIAKCQIRDTHACPRISKSNFGIFKFYDCIV